MAPRQSTAGKRGLAGGESLTSSQQQDYALRTLRRAVQLHSARRAAGNVASSGSLGAGGAGRVESYSQQATQPAGASQLPPSSQSFSQSQGAPQDTLPCSWAGAAPHAEPLQNSQKKLNEAGCDGWPSASLSTQTPSYLGPSSNPSQPQGGSSQPLPAVCDKYQSQPLFSAQTAPSAADRALPLGSVQSQPLFPQVPDAQIPSLPLPAGQGLKVKAASAAAKLSSDVAAAATALAAALQGVSSAPLPIADDQSHRSRLRSSSHQRSSRAPSRREQRRKLPRQSRHRRNTSFEEPPPKRRRYRCKAPPPPSPSSPSPSRSPAHTRCSYSETTSRSPERRRQLAIPVSRSYQPARESTAGIASAQHRDLVTITQQAAAASGKTLTQLAQDLSRADQEHFSQLRGSLCSKDDAKEALALVTEYQSACAESDATLASVVSIVEESLRAMNSVLAARANNRSSMTPSNIHAGKFDGLTSGRTNVVAPWRITDGLLGKSVGGALQPLPIKAAPHRRRSIDGVTR